MDVATRGVVEALAQPGWTISESVHHRTFTKGNLILHVEGDHPWFAGVRVLWCGVPIRVNRRAVARAALGIIARASAVATERFTAHCQANILPFRAKGGDQ